LQVTWHNEIVVLNYKPEIQNKMKNKFDIHKGELLFEEECLHIHDRQPAWFKTISMISLIAILLYGVISIVKGLRENDTANLWISVAIISLGIPAMVVQSRISYDNRIEYKYIRKIKIHRNLTDQLLADIILDTGKKRRIILDEEDFGQFGRDHLDELVEAFNGRQLPAVLA